MQNINSSSEPIIQNAMPQSIRPVVKEANLSVIVRFHGTRWCNNPSPPLTTTPPPHIVYYSCSYLRGRGGHEAVHGSSIQYSCQFPTVCGLSRIKRLCAPSAKSGGRQTHIQTTTHEQSYIDKHLPFL